MACGTFGAVLFNDGLRLLLVDCREIVIANADHPTTQGFASLVENELHEWKFQLKMPGGVLQFILFGNHFSHPQGRAALQLGLCNSGPHRFNTGGC
jgi:hypothetical protein